MKLIEYIDNGEVYRKKFEEWEASEQIFDENRMLYTLRKPGSTYEKVCLYIDNYFMCVYGDYGTMTFNNMTWKGNVFNLQYDNIGYQMEKLSHESRNTLEVYDESYCEEDIKNWFKDQLMNQTHFSPEEITNVLKYFDEVGYDEWYVDEFIEENRDFFDSKELLKYFCEMMSNTDEYEWIAFLRRTSDTLQDFEEVCDSELWRAGKRIAQRYYINMLALQICAEKLKKGANTE